MKIYGFQKTTLLDYPEHVAATIFTGGCNFRCSFCQNAGLVELGRTRRGSGMFPDGSGQQILLDAGDRQIHHDMHMISEENVLAHLKKRQGILDGVCITGGEPTLQPDLEEFIRKVRDMGYKVKLDSNGYRPEVLKSLLKQGLLDYVAMDVKASKGNYACVAGLDQGVTGLEHSAVDLGAQHNTQGLHLEYIEESIALLQTSGIPYEFRTTAVKGLHTVEEFEEIGRWLAGSRVYFIQSYREDGEILNGAGLGSFSLEELREMRRLAGKYIARVELRGVE